jgi:hypothetical protein
MDAPLWALNSMIASKGIYSPGKMALSNDSDNGDGLQDSLAIFGSKILSNI